MDNKKIEMITFDLVKRETEQSLNECLFCGNDKRVCECLNF